MSDRVTEERLEETDRLLGESGDGDPGVAPGGVDEDAGGPVGRSRAERSAGEGAPSSRFGEFPSAVVSPTDLFGPKVFLGLVLAFGAGGLVGATTIPFAGQAVGPLAVAFLFGLAASERRYAEVTVASVVVGALGAVIDGPVIALAGSATTVAAVGAGVGLLSCTLGYYFGRDLRNGLFRELE